MAFPSTEWKAEEHSLQHGDLELESTEDLSETLDVSQQAAGVTDLGGVDLRVVLLHTRQPKHLARNQQIGFGQEMLSAPPTWSPHHTHIKGKQGRSCYSE